MKYEAMKTKDMLQLLIRAGWAQNNTRGKHQTWKSPGGHRIVSVTIGQADAHPGEVKKVRDIIEEAYQLEKELDLLPKRQPRERVPVRLVEPPKVEEDKGPPSKVVLPASNIGATRPPMPGKPFERTPTVTVPDDLPNGGTAFITDYCSVKRYTRKIGYRWEVMTRATVDGKKRYVAGLTGTDAEAIHAQTLDLERKAGMHAAPAPVTIGGTTYSAVWRQEPDSPLWWWSPGSHAGRFALPSGWFDRNGPAPVKPTAEPASVEPEQTAAEEGAPENNETEDTDMKTEEKTEEKNAPATYEADVEEAISVILADANRPIVRLLTGKEITRVQVIDMLLRKGLAALDGE